MTDFVHATCLAHHSALRGALLDGPISLPRGTENSTQENSTQENSTQKTQHIVKSRKLNTRKLNTENSTQNLNTFNYY